MDTCLAIEQYKQKLIEITNSSSLTIGAVLYVLKDFLHIIETDYMKTLQKEIAAPQEQIQNIKFDSSGAHIIDTKEEELQEE